MNEMPTSNGNGKNFRLRWTSHQGTILSYFDTLFSAQNMCDCSLAIKGHQIQAHRSILSACSNFLAEILSVSLEKYPIIFLKDVELNELKALLNFMYRGEVSMCEERLPKFLSIAEDLEIRGLSTQSAHKKPLYSEVFKVPNTSMTSSTPELENTSFSSKSHSTNNFLPLPLPSSSSVNTKSNTSSPTITLNNNNSSSFKSMLPREEKEPNNYSNKSPSKLHQSTPSVQKKVGFALDSNDKPTIVQTKPTESIKNNGTPSPIIKLKNSSNNKYDIRKKVNQTNSSVSSSDRNKNANHVMRVRERNLCSACKKIFSTKEALQLHVKVRCPASKKKHKCNKCQANFSDARTYKLHQVKCRNKIDIRLLKIRGRPKIGNSEKNESTTKSNKIKA